MTASVTRMTGTPIPPTPVARRWGIGFAAIWLFFLADPLAAAWNARDTVAGVVGGVTTILFGAYYMTIWVRLRRDRNDFAGPPSTDERRSAQARGRGVPPRRARKGTSGPGVDRGSRDAV